MSKKKKDEDEFFDLLQHLKDTFEDMSEEEREVFERIAKGDLNIGGAIDENWHTCELPDYSSMIHPIAEWLQPLATFSRLSEIKELCEQAAREAEKLERGQLVADLHNFIYTYLAFMLGENKVFRVKRNNKHLFAAFWLIARFNLTEMLDDVLETLKQKYDVLNYIYLTGTEFVGTAIIYEIGKNQMEKLVEFLNSSGYIPMAKPIVFDALAYIYKFEPDLRLKALHHINNYLQRCLDIGLEGGHVANISHYAHTLACVHAKETLPMLRRIYKNVDIPAIEVRDLKEVEKIMGDPKKTLNEILPKNMDDFINDLEKFAKKEELDEKDDQEDDWDDDDWDDDDDLDEDWEELDDDEVDEDDDDWDDENDEDDEDWEDEDDECYLFNEDMEQKKYILKVNLEGTKNKVERLLQVPSNMYLDSLVDFLFITFDWIKISSTMSWFESGRRKYIENDPSDQEPDGVKVFRAADYVVSEVISRRSPSVGFCMQVGSTIWRCKVRLEETGMYDEDGEEPYVKLLKAKGPFPVYTMLEMGDYERCLKAGRLDEPDIEEINEEISDYENTLL
ncbi:MAG: hypothetical protein J5529_05315 [Prevotella sp.]|nr:hypothetical protein [Prevotella sp.]